MAATARQVPIHFQSPWFSEVEVGPFRITEVRLGPGQRIEPHFHDRPNIGLMLGGGFDLGFRGRDLECRQGSLFFEPAGETHCNCVGCRGAWVLAVQPDPADSSVTAAFTPGFGEPAERAHPFAASLGRRIAAEVGCPDGYSNLMIQGHCYEVLGLLGRAGRAPSPRWLGRIEAMLRETGPASPGIADLAREAGVHPAHLAREFRRRFGRSLGGFALDRRLDWAAAQLRETDRPVAAIAADAGFADQSHFTRRFRRFAGTTPAAYRRRSRP